MDAATIYKRVSEYYGSAARNGQTSQSEAIAQAFGYTEAELQSIPQNANLGLSCGNPLALASLREGETVVDLGSGAGFDIFLAAQKVGPTGRAVGIDMNEDMLARARNNLATLPNAAHISFIKGQITSIPLENGFADCVISNCVINLVPEAEKPKVFAEIARILKPGGRVAVSDILSRKPFPPELRESIGAYVGCVAGCSSKEQYEQYLHENGFSGIMLVDAQSDLNIYTQPHDTSNDGTTKTSAKEVASSSCCAGPNSPPVVINNCCTKATEAVEDPSTPWDLADIDVNEWAGSYKIFAVK